jgi:hypothetical protein
MKRAAFILALFLALPSWAGRSFNGTTDQISVSGSGTAIDLTGSQMSAACWFMLTAAPTGEVECFSKWASGGSGGYLINYNQAGHAGQVGTGIYISIPLNHLHELFCTPVTVLNVWHVAVFTYQNNNTMKMWLDGNQCATDSGIGSTGALVSSGNNLNFGGIRQTQSCCFIQGLIAEAAVWNVFLSAAEAKSLATICPLSVHRTAIVGYWPLYGASGSSIEPDLSGNVLNGTLTGTATANHPPCSP